MAHTGAASTSSGADTNALQQFITESKFRLQTILSRLHWSAELVKKAFNTNTQARLKAEIPITDEQEPNLPPSCATSNSLVVAPNELQQIVGVSDVQAPEKFSDLQSNFTREQKLSIYEHVVQHTEKCIEPEMTVPSLGEGNLTFAEIVAQKRRETKKKRRYRRSKPTQIEEVRGLVELQMQAMQHYMEAKAAEERKLQRARNGREYEHTHRDEHRKASNRSRSRSSRRHRSWSRNRKHQRSRSRSRKHQRDRSGSRKHQRSRSRSKKRHRSRNRSSSRNRLRMDAERATGNYEHKKENRRQTSRQRSASQIRPRVDHKSSNKVLQRSRSRSRSHNRERHRKGRGRSRSREHKTSHKGSKHDRNGHKSAYKDQRLCANSHAAYSRSSTSSRHSRHEPSK